jgi:hypothetical protein
LRLGAKGSGSRHDKALERALDAMRDLPADAQDDIAQIVLRLPAADDDKPFR